MYVSDHDYMKIHAFFFDGTYLGRVEETEGNLGAPADFTIYEGAFPPLSTFELPASNTAGTDIVVPLQLNNHRDLPIAPEFPSPPASYTLEATGTLPGTNFTSTITGSVAQDELASSATSLSASLNIPFAGTWEVSVKGGTSNPQSFLDSPATVTILAAPTDPSSCTTTFANIISAGAFFSATTLAFDC